MTSSSASSVNGPTELRYTDADFKRVAGIMFEDSGITLSSEKASLVYSRLAKRLRAVQIDNFKSYCEFVSTKSGAIERREMLSALTTNVTHFFREPHHFNDLRSRVLPPLLQRAKHGERVRIWSAGCSSGQEIYSILLTLLELEPALEKYDIKILATDIDPKILERGRAATYVEAAMTNVSESQKKRYFSKINGGGDVQWRLSERVASMVQFKELNLTRTFPVKGPIDIIFCRNVVIYFEKKTEEDVWTRLANVLAPQGWLFVGHSERVSGPAEKVMTGKGITTYQKNG